jgi:hypothetical protein
MFGGAMSKKTSETNEIVPTEDDLVGFFSELARQFPGVVGEVEPFEGPSGGLFRETDIRLLPARAQSAFRAMGRLFWKQFHTVVAQQPGGPLTRGLPPLPTLLPAVAEELRFSLRILTIGDAVARTAQNPVSTDGFPGLAAETLERLTQLVQALEGQLPALLAQQEISGANRPS